jgi:microcystin-dependent protein
MSKSRKHFIKGLAGALTLGWLFSGSENAQANESKNEFSELNDGANRMVAEPLLGSLMLFAGNFAPRGWAFCNGQLLPISQNSALFSLLGTQYGGDGRTTFALPDLRGRVPIGPGQGAGLSNYQVGQKTGFEETTLTAANLPSHTHTLNASSSPGTSSSPNGNLPAVNRDGILHYGSSADVTMSSASVANTGGGQPINNVQPVLGIHYCIALQGIYPSRS